MEIRRYEDRADARAVGRVQARSWRAAYDDLLPKSVLEAQQVNPPAEQVDAYHEDLVGNREGVFLAERGTDIIGFADFRWGDAETKAFVDEGEAGLKAIYVTPRHWGESVGTALLNRGLAALPDRVRTLRLEMLEGNDIGARFYESRGFERTGTREYEIASETYPTVIYARDLSSTG